MQKNQQKQQVIKSAGAMSLGTLLSRILGFVRDQVLATYFPVQSRDIFIVAFRLPNMFRRIFGEGALSVSFIPVYVEQQTSDLSQAKNLANAIYSLLMILMSCLTVLGLAFMGPIMSYMVGGEGYTLIPGKLDMTITAARWMFGYLFLVTNYAFLMAILQAHRQFLWPALAPALFNLFFIICALLPKPLLNFEIANLAVGVLIGGVIQLLTVVVPLWRQNLMPRWTLKWRVPGVFIILRNMVPGVIGMSLLQIMAIANVYFASLLEQGSHSHIYFADRILELPHSLIAISLGAALLPMLSEYWGKSEKEKMLEASQKYMRVLLFLALPAAVGMYTLALPIVQVLFLKGEFRASDAVATAGVLQIYSLLLLATSLNKVTIPSFYAIKNTWLPSLVSGLCILLHIGLASYWLRTYGLNGLVASTTFTGVVNVTLILIFYRFMIGSLNLKALVKSIVLLTPSLFVLAGVCLFLYPMALKVFGGFMGEFWARLLALIFVIGLSVVNYFSINKLIKHPEWDEVMQLVRRK